jgi:hypothetical protein
MVNWNAIEEELSSEEVKFRGPLTLGAELTPSGSSTSTSDMPESSSSVRGKILENPRLLLLMLPGFKRERER